MYLVLTAMLALNVSIEILSGYSLVDGSLRKSIAIADARNIALKNQFEDLAAKNKTKTAEWKVKAENVVTKSDSLYNFINDIKREIIVLIDGKDAPGLATLDISDGGRGDLNITGQVGMTNQNSFGFKAGEKLKESLNAYSEFLLTLVTDSAKRTSIQQTFATEGRYSAEAKRTIGWEEGVFDNMPAVATLTLLSKIQNDIRNTEAEIIQYLIAQIDAGDFRVNKIDAMAIANSNYVIRGGKYRAEIILAATDSTQTLDIEINGAKIEKSAEGKYIYEVPVSAIGKREFKGTITMTKPDETTVTYPFTETYMVAEPSATISADMMNVFYAGINNPVSVSVPGVAAGDVEISISNAKFVRTSKGWNVTPIQVGVVSKVTVTALFDGKKTVVGSKDFRVKPLPPPLAKLAFTDAKNQPFKGGKIRKNILITAKRVIAELDDADLDVEYKVLSFSLNYNDSMGNTLVEATTGSELTSKQLGIFKNLTPGKTVYITNVQAEGPDKIKRRLPPLDIALGN
jgi:gliding motility-associated protein GldM